MNRPFEWVIEAIGWLQLVASPLLIGSGIGALVYFLNPTTTTFVIGISTATLGLLIGILWATKIWKTKEGTIGYLARIRRTPELNLKNTEMNDESGDKKKDII